MPNIKSAMKRLRSNAKKEDRNQSMLSEIKTLKKNLAKLEAAPAEASTLAAKLVKRFDQAAVKGIIPKGRANRNKSRIQAFLTRISKKK